MRDLPLERRAELLSLYPEPSSLLFKARHGWKEEDVQQDGFIAKDTWVDTHEFSLTAVRSNAYLFFNFANSSFERSFPCFNATTGKLEETVKNSIIRSDLGPDFEAIFRRLTIKERQRHGEELQGIAAFGFFTRLVSSKTREPRKVMYHGIFESLR